MLSLTKEAAAGFSTWLDHFLPAVASINSTFGHRGDYGCCECVSKQWIVFRRQSVMFALYAMIPALLSSPLTLPVCCYIRCRSPVEHDEPLPDAAEAAFPAAQGPAVHLSGGASCVGGRRPLPSRAQRCRPLSEFRLGWRPRAVSAQGSECIISAAVIRAVVCEWFINGWMDGWMDG